MSVRTMTICGGLSAASKQILGCNTLTAICGYSVLDAYNLRVINDGGNVGNESCLLDYINNIL